MRAAVGLGSNLGDRAASLRHAIDSLAAAGGLLAVSSFHETDPVGGPAQGRYLNAALVLETDLTPRRLFARMQRIERDAGRDRSKEARWGPRTLDLDLLLCDDQVLEEPGLKVPHPRMAARAFVLAPLAEIAPDWVVPGTGKTVEALLADHKVAH